MCKTVCKSACFVSFRQELPAPHDSLSPHVFILCPFRYQPRYYRFRPFSEPGSGDIVSQIRHFFLRLLQGLKVYGEAVIRHLQTAFLRFRAALFTTQWFSRCSWTRYARFSASAMHKQAWHGARLNRKVRFHVPFSASAELKLRLVLHSAQSKGSFFLSCCKSCPDFLQACRAKISGCPDRGGFVCGQRRDFWDVVWRQKDDIFLKYL